MTTHEIEVHLNAIDPARNNQGAIVSLAKVCLALNKKVADLESFQSRAIEQFPSLGESARSIGETIRVSRRDLKEIRAKGGV